MKDQNLMMGNKIFFSKILLFGEYGVIKNSKALVIPYKKYFGSLKFSKTADDYQKTSNTNLKVFSDYLKDNKFIYNKINITKFKYDIDNGLYFESSIPESYGLGSSAAVVAAVYYSYKDQNKEELEINNLKSILSRMESFFHGNSSGIDPLSCYIQKPVLVESKINVKLIDVPDQNLNSNRALFLVDTNSQGNTQTLVKTFFEKLDDINFQSFFENDFVSVINDTIINFLECNYEEFEKNFIDLSKKTFANFQEMVPDNFKKLWIDGIENEEYYLKLCGSGGGGYLIGLTKNLKKIEKYFPDKKIEILFEF